MEEYVLLGTTLQYSTQRLNFFSISGQFDKIDAKAEQKFREGYKKLGNLKAVYEQFPSLLHNVITWVDEQALDHIKLQEIYTVSRSDLSNAGQSSVDGMKRTYQERIMDPYEAIQHKKEADAARRELKKKIKSNDLWDSIGYTAINAVGNMGSSIGAEMDAGSVYRDEEILRLFLEDLHDYVLSVMIVTIRLIEKNSNIRYDLPRGEDLKSARNLEKNILNGSVPPEKRDQMALQVLQANPTAFDLYDFLLDNHGDADHTLEKMADRFGYDNFKAHKASVLKDVFSSPLSRTYTEEEDVLNLKKRVADYAEYLGVSPEKEMAVLDRQWKAIDLRLRTANGKEYETREQAQDVRDDFVLRDQKAASYDLKRINFLDSTQLQQFIRCLTDLPYKSADVPQGIPAFVDHITRQAVDRCTAIDMVHAPNNAVEGVERIWTLSGLYEQVASKMKFGSAGAELVQKNKTQLTMRGEESLCLCQDISKLLSPGKLLLITTQNLYLVSGKDTAAFPLEEILGITPEGSGCSIQLKDKPAYQTPFLIKLSDDDMNRYSRILFNTVEALRLRNVPFESIYVPVAEALAAEPQVLTGLNEPSSAKSPAAAPEVPVPPQIDSTITISDKDDLRTAYAKALVACGGTPEGIQAAYRAAETESNKAGEVYTAELKNVPGAGTAHAISLVAAFGFFFGLASIFFLSLVTGLLITAVCMFIFSVTNKQEKTLMEQAASAQSREAHIRHEEAEKRLTACKAYLKAKKEAEEKGISPADVQDLIAELTMQG